MTSETNKLKCWLYRMFVRYHDNPYSQLGLSWPWSYGRWIKNYLCNQCLSPPMLGVRISIRARRTTLCDQVYQWLATCRWFSPGLPVSATNKAECHDITDILLKVALSTIKQTNKQTFRVCQWLAVVFSGSSGVLHQ